MPAHKCVTRPLGLYTVTQYEISINIANNQYGEC